MIFKRNNCLGMTSDKKMGELSRADRVKFFGFEYLLGRKVSKAQLAFLVMRDLLFLNFLTVPKILSLDLQSFRRICVCKLDHLGDILIATPFLGALREAAPNAKIILVVGAHAQTLAVILREQKLVDEVICYSSVLLNRSNQNIFKKALMEARDLYRFSASFRKNPPDVFWDARPYSPSAWLLGILSGAKIRIGFGLRGMAMSYHYLTPFRSEFPMGQVLLEAVSNLGYQERTYIKPLLKREFFESSIPKGLPKAPYVCVQCASGEKIREVDFQLWINIICLISQCWPVVLLGSAPSPTTELLERIPNVISLEGKTNLRQALAVIAKSFGVISVDSFAAHAALAFDIPVAVLMKEGVSNRLSFPVGNENLHFFNVNYSVPEKVLELFQHLKYRPLN